MEIQVKASEKACIISFAGKLDAISAPEYEKAVTQLITDGETRLVIDFAELSYVSSAGLRVILSTVKQLKSKGGEAMFANLQDVVRDVFEMTGFTSILAVHPSVDAALAPL